MDLPDWIAETPHDCPILIAGPTASGKSALALAIARHSNGLIVNGDALQVYANWHILTARPSEEDERKNPHRLYGHIAGDQDYSVGDWLSSVRDLLAQEKRLIIVGGTGLYFKALTNGLADIPKTEPELRKSTQALYEQDGLRALLEHLDGETLAKIDTQNPMRVMRAYEIQMQTGRSIVSWHAQTPPPVLSLKKCLPLVMETPKEILNARINDRFEQMLAHGALDEARANLATWCSTHPSSKAIGAKELIAYLKGDMSLSDAQNAATLATRQYAKRQRTWFRNNMTAWTALDTRTL